MLGQEYDGNADKKDFDPIFDPLQTFSGKISQFEIWNTILSSTDIKKLADCNIATTKTQNRILSWNANDWKLSGHTTISNLPLSEFCQKNIVSNQLIWPRAISFDKFSSYCGLMDGIPPVVYKNSLIKEIYNEVKDIFINVNTTSPSGFLDKTRKVGIRCFVSKTNSEMDFWSGMKWNQVEGKWYSPFKPFENISLKAEIQEEGFNCGYFYDNLFHNIPCQRKFPCGICKVPHDKLIFLKGLCNYGYDIFDMRYYVHGLKNNRPYFR